MSCDELNKGQFFVLKDMRPLILAGNDDSQGDMGSLSYIDLKDNMTLGMSMDTSPDGKVVVRIFIYN